MRRNSVGNNSVERGEDLVYLALGLPGSGNETNQIDSLERRILGRAGVSAYKDHGGNTKTNSRGGAWVGCGHSPRMFHAHVW